jgi:hypothetical protein
MSRNEICFQNYIKFTKNPKQTKILILQFAKSIAEGHSSEKTKIDFFSCNCFDFFVKHLCFCIILTSQTNTCHTCIFTGDHGVVGGKNARVHIFDGK